MAAHGLKQREQPFGYTRLARNRKSDLLAAVRSVEDDPRLHRFAEIHETMRDSGGHEEEVAGLERHDLAAHFKLSLPLDDHVALVTAVRRLVVHFPGHVQLDLQLAALQGNEEPVSIRSGDLRGNFRGGDSLAGVSLHVNSVHLFSIEV